MTPEARGVEVPRHYGTPQEEYRAAVAASAVADRSHRARWKVTGRDPQRMLDGIVTSRIPDPFEPLAAGTGSGGAWRGEGKYGAVLTAKGKLVTDHRLFRLGEGEENAFLLDLPATAVDGAREHFGRFLPPRFARVADVSTETGMLTVVGPDSARSVAAVVPGLAPGVGITAEELGDELDRLEEHEVILFDREDEVHGPLRIVRSACVAPLAFDVIADTRTTEAVWRSLREAGTLPLGLSVWETLRVEAGTPAFGVDMDAETIPVEAGIHTRAIDYEKGCYTGQEVIVRIRDRGRVNRHLRGLRMGSVPTPPAGTELYLEGKDRPVGEVTSAVDSPRYGEVAGLGYVRREVEPPGVVRLESPEGDSVRVYELGALGYGPETP